MRVNGEKVGHEGAHVIRSALQTLESKVEQVEDKQGIYEPHACFTGASEGRL
jgi:hypothetical protein